MSKHLKADNIRTLCGIDFSVLDYKVAGVVELPEDATCEWCVAEAAAPTTSNISNASLDDELLIFDILAIFNWGCVLPDDEKKLVKAKQALTAYIQQECDRARIDEVNRFVEETALGADFAVVKEFTDDSRLYAPIQIAKYAHQRAKQLKDLNQGGEADGQPDYSR